MLEVIPLQPCFTDDSVPSVSTTLGSWLAYPKQFPNLLRCILLHSVPRLKLCLPGCPAWESVEKETLGPFTSADPVSPEVLITLRNKL